MEVNVDPGTYYSWVHGFGYYTPTSTKKTFVQVVLKRFSQAAQPTACIKGQYKSTMVKLVVVNRLCKHRLHRRPT